MEKKNWRNDISTETKKKDDSSGCEALRLGAWNSVVSRKVFDREHEQAAVLAQIGPFRGSSSTHCVCCFVILSGSKKNECGSWKLDSPNLQLLL
mmetsp:Transcript_25909/g.55462  ORF Transcript_25909/g.55462 Transcript_25909/m.55462 type:complete len:94 (+) Transcript_25909:904-1185(+)